MEWVPVDSCYVSESGKTADSGGRYRIKKEMDWYIVYLDGSQVNMKRTLEEAMASVEARK